MLKDPDSVLDFGVSWSAWLVDGDTIASSEWIIPDGITMDPEHPATHDDTSTTIWVTGGDLGDTYRITNRITTTAGRVDDRTLTIKIRSR